MGYEFVKEAPPDMSERTPLIQTVVVTQREPRRSHPLIRRLCTTGLGCLLVLLVLASLLSLFTVPNGHHYQRSHHGQQHWSEYLTSWPLPGTGPSFEEVQNILLTTPDPERLRLWSEYYASGPDLAGTNLSQALWTRARWEEAGIKSEIIAYDVYLNYPVDHRLALLRDNKVEYECSLEEDVIDEDPTTALDDRVPTFHGYSASGNVTGPYVYVNFGTWWDFEALIAANVSLEGKIALAKYGENFRGLKVGIAEDLGMLGVVMYSDPQSDGNITELNGYKPYPDGPARQPSSVQRGSTQFIATLPGDPTTPGYPSKPGVPRADPHGAIPDIPSIPISYQDALPLLRALNGHGPDASSFGDDWLGGLTHKGVQYNIGPSPDSLTLNLVNEQQYVTTPIWNVIGIINGTIPDEVIVLGNHRDAWIAGGAGDPHSGSAALIEVVKAFGQAVAAGWKPLRTIVFASWDGEEYGLLGSTEWVEEFIPWISSSVVAYLNVDISARGSVFNGQSSPLLSDVFRKVTSLVELPDGGTVADNWDGKMATLGSGSDFAAFLQFAGIPALDFGYVRGDNDPVYHYHSNYDSFHWMDKFGDAKWEQHLTTAKVWALTAVTLSETPVLQMNATLFAHDLISYVDEVKAIANESSIPHKAFSFEALDSAASRLYLAAEAFDAHAADLSSQLLEPLPWWQIWKKLLVMRAIRKVNTKYKNIEKSFLHAGGLDRRPWYKHVVFAPGRWTGYAGARFPCLVENFEDKNITGVQKWSDIISEKLLDAATLLEDI